MSKLYIFRSGELKCAGLPTKMKVNKAMAKTAN